MKKFLLFIPIILCLVTFGYAVLNTTMLPIENFWLGTICLICIAGIAVLISEEIDKETKVVILEVKVPFKFHAWKSQDVQINLDRFTHFGLEHGLTYHDSVLIVYDETETNTEITNVYDYLNILINDCNK